MSRLGLFFSLGLAALLIGLLLGGPHLVGESRLRGWAAPKLANALHQEVTIDGAMSLALLPSPRIAAEQVRIGRIALLPRVELELQIPPLLQLQLQPKAVRLVRPELRLDALPAIAAASLPSAAAPADAAPSAAPAAARSSWQGRIIVEQGSLILAEGSPAGAVAPLDLTLQFGEDQADLGGHGVWRDIGFTISGTRRRQATELALRLDQGGELVWRGQGTPSALQGKLAGMIDRVDRLAASLPPLPRTLSAELNWNGSLFAVRQIALKLGESDWQGDAHWDGGALAVDRLEAVLPGKGALSLSGALSAGPRFVGSFEARSEDPAARLAGDIRAEADRILLDKATLKLDQGRIDLAAEISSLSPRSFALQATGEMAGGQLHLAGQIADKEGRWQFDPAHAELHSRDLGRTLKIFGIDLPVAEPAELAAELSGPLAAPHMALSAPRLDLGKIRLEAPQAVLAVEGDRLRLDPVSAGVYGGKLTGSASLARGGGAIALNLTLSGAQMRQALLELADLGLADGVMEGEVKLTTTGAKPAERLAHLDGTARLVVRDGRVKGFDLAAADRALAEKPGIGGLIMLLQAGLTGGATHFSSLSGSARVKGGVITSDDLKLVAEGGGATGAAMVDLPGDRVEAHADFRFASAADAPPLGMRLIGSLESPRRFLDVKPLQQWLAEHGVKTGKPKDLLKSLLQGLVR